MDAKELIRAGKLSEARALLLQKVKSAPADLAKRTLLFQVLSFCGEWDKAERHLDVIAGQDAARETGVQVYKNIIEVEKSRLAVLKNDARPSFLPAMPSYTEKYFTAWQKVTEQQIDHASRLFGEIEDRLPKLSGTVDGKAFSGFRDSDTFLRRFLEAVVHERYVWIPFESIREMSTLAPKTLFDLLWIAARVTMRDGLVLSCYLPVLYPGSHMHREENVQLGRVTDWEHLGGDFYRACGQHVFQVGEEELAILDIREIIFDNLESAGEDE